jgi:UTP--glucose-1-phosphate uridylyltransferase
MTDEVVLAASEKMRNAGQSEAAIRAFASAIERVRGGAATMIPSSELEPAPDVPAFEQLPEVDPGPALERLAVLKLNGGLATSMGLRQPKSLLQAREGRTFLQLIVGQTLALRRRHGVRLPLILMNSQATREPTLAALAEFPELATPGLPMDFLQSMVPKLDAETMLPARWPAAPELEWCPPGHGDVYAALVGSGMLEALLERGFRYVMISNADNLAAVVDPRIAGHLERERIPFLMEVVIGTAADRKGGHIARRLSDGRLVLRETAQTPPQDAESFRDYRRWRYYNTNSLWIDLEALSERFADGGSLELPVIVNRKTVDPRDPQSPPVLQLESAMGAAIGSFPGARLLQVPRSRFIPVKTTDDLLVLRSDAFVIGSDDRVELAAGPGARPPLVTLDRAHFGLIDGFEQRFPSGPPSLREAEHLEVIGDVSFGAGVTVRGTVRLDAPPGGMRVADGALLQEG